MEQEGYVAGPHATIRGKDVDRSDAISLGRDQRGATVPVGHPDGPSLKRHGNGEFVGQRCDSGHNLMSRIKRTQTVGEEFGRSMNKRFIPACGEATSEFPTAARRKHGNRLHDTSAGINVIGQDVARCHRVRKRGVTHGHDNIVRSQVGQRGHAGRAIEVIDRADIRESCQSGPEYRWVSATG